MNTRNTVDPGSGVIAFSTTPVVEQALERAAAADLMSRANYVRKVVVMHLRQAGLLGTDERIVNPRGRPRKMATA